MANSLNLKSVDWLKMEEVLAKHLGPNPVDVGDSGKTASVYSEELLLVLLNVYDEDNGQCAVHIRGCAPPHLAAFVTGVLSAHFPIIIDRPFEFDDEGELVFGYDALKLSVKKVKEVWFGPETQKSGPHYNKPKLLN